MATASSRTAPPRVRDRRLATVEEALDHAEAIAAEAGVGAITVVEVARRTGMRGPSLYKYFPSLHALLDALFERGWRRVVEAVEDAARDVPPGLPALEAGSRAFVLWVTSHPGLAPLLIWRPVPGFVPGPTAYAQSERLAVLTRGALADAVARGQLRPDADTEETLRLLTGLMSGLCSQQLANQPGAPVDEGVFSSLTPRALSMFTAFHAP